MSTEAAATARKKRSATDSTAKRTSEDDHRRKRRNRTTQSCLNCHTSKRMCDRKRPCGRCTQLGLTGLCVYEVDDPSQRNDTSDEKSRLQKRVAELESVVRELKNKPHPRWVQPGNSASGDAEKRSQNETSVSTSPILPDSDEADLVSACGSSPSGSSTSVHLHLPRATSLRSSPANDSIPGSSSSHSSVFGSPSPITTPSPLALNPVDAPVAVATEQQYIPGGYDLTSFLSSCYSETGLDRSLDSILDGMIRSEGINHVTADPCLAHHQDHAHMDGHCGCLNDPASYNVVLELSLRLRRAADILGHHMKHRTTPSCAMYQRVADLDRFTTDSLGNINIPPNSFPCSNHSHPVLPSTSTTTTTFPSALHRSTTGQTSSHAPTISPQSLHGMRTWDYSSSAYPSPPREDSFMSWEPPHHPTDWPQSGLL